VKDRGFKIQPVAKTLVFPMGIYSQKYKSVDALPGGATVGIPNDPTNGGRALLLLQANGLIKLRDGAGLRAGPADIVENKKNLRIRELDAAMLPRALGDLDAAAVNTNYAIEAKLDPTKDTIARETTESPYTNVIAVRSEDVNKPWVAKLVKAYHSASVKQFAHEKFKGAAVPAW
jgi:D-methionine transport system substrate-binding protein